MATLLVPKAFIAPKQMNYWGKCGWAARLRRSRMAIAIPPPAGCVTTTVPSPFSSAALRAEYKTLANSSCVLGAANRITPSGVWISDIAINPWPDCGV